MTDRTIPAAAGLCVTAGVVDSLALLRAGHYASHVTGTTTHGIAGVFEGDLSTGGMALLVVAAFAAGSAACGIVLTAPRSRNPARSAAGLVAVETVVIAVAGGILLAWPGGPGVPACVAMLGFAMGLQNATSTYLLKPWQRTTHITSNLTDLGSEIGMRLRRWAGRPSGEMLAAPDGDTLGSAAGAVLGFAAGAVAGCSLARMLGDAGVLAACVIPAFVALRLASDRPHPLGRRCSSPTRKDRS